MVVNKYYRQDSTPLEWRLRIAQSNNISLSEALRLPGHQASHAGNNVEIYERAASRSNNLKHQIRMTL